MVNFAGGSDGEKVQNVRFLNSESNSGVFALAIGNFRRAFPFARSQGKARAKRPQYNGLLPAGFALEAVQLNPTPKRS